jgi:hypothetical protein
MMRIYLNNEKMWMYILCDWTDRYTGPTKLSKVLSKVRPNTMLYYSYVKLCGGRDPSVQYVNEAFKEFLGGFDEGGRLLRTEMAETGTGRILRYFGDDLYEVE